MIEAVNSVIASASQLRAAADQADAARAATSESVRETPKAPYVSPYVTVDHSHNKAVLQVRDSNTGDVVRQFPSESRLRQLAAEQASQQGGEANTQSDGDTIQVSDEDTSSVSQDSSVVIAEARAASAALVNGSQAGAQNLSAGVSVLA